MIQLAVQANNGEPGARRYLDLYETQPIKLTLSIEDITTTDTTAVYSQTFRIPATGNNSQFFVTAFDINGFDFDVSQKQSAELIVDGDIYQSGEIRLLKVFIDEQDNHVDYELLFLGTTRGLASSVGDGRMCDLDLSNLSHTYNIANIETSWQAYPEGAAGAGLVNGDIVYPIVDFGNTYSDDFLVQETRISNGSNLHFTNPANPLPIDRLRPCIRAKALWDKIFANAGFTYESTFLDSNLFKHLYMGAWGEEATLTLLPYNNAYNTLNINAGGAQILLPINEQQSDGFDLVNETYTVVADGSYDIVHSTTINTYWTDLTDPTPKTAEWRLRIWKTTGGVNTILAETIFEQELNTGAQVFSFASVDVIDQALVTGDIIYGTIQLIASNDWGGTLIQNGRFGIQQKVSSNPGIALSCDYLQIDFIKDIISKFRLALAPDRSIPNKFIIEPWSEYIGSGEQLDWTDKMDLSKDIQVEPILYTQKERITFEDKAGEDFLNVLNQTDIGETFGTLNYDSQSPLLKDTRQIKTKLEPLPVIQFDGSSQGANGGDNFIIAQIHDHEAEVRPTNGSAVVLHNPCKPGVRLFWYNGLKHTGTILAYDVTWYLQDGGTTNSYTKFPMISHFNEWGDRDDSWQGLDTLTKDLCWQRETGYILYDLANVNVGGSVYDYYWSRYTNTLYDPFSRRVTMYLKLDKFDLVNFSFDDAIFLKNGWYYVEKINSVDLEADSSVKVELIRLRDFSVLPKSFIPPSGLPQNWENVTDQWQLITDNWEAV